MLDSKLNPKVSKLNVIELASIIGDEHKQNPEPNNDNLRNKFLHLGFGDRSQWLGFHPLGEVVHDHDEEFLQCYHHRKWTKDIYPPLCEGPWYGDGCQRD